MPEPLRLSSLCNRSALQVLNHPQMVYILTEIFPGEMISTRRLPINFALLLDRSGSMAGEKLRTMRSAVKRLVDQLQPEDILSIITFETRTQVLVPAQPVRDKESIKHKIDLIEDGGGTNMALGLKEALRQVQQNLNTAYVNRIVLLTDGEATDRLDDSRKLADQAGEMNIPMIGLGLGSNWKEEFVMDLADRSLRAPGSGKGYADYIPSAERISDIFQQVFQLMQVVAQDVTLTVRMVQGMEARRVWQVVPVIKDLGGDIIQGRSIVAPIGQLPQNGVAHLMEITVPPKPAGAYRILQSEVSFKAPDGSVNRQTADTIVEFTPDATLANKINGKVMNIVEKVQAFKLQTRALEDIQAGDPNSATKKLRQAVTLLLSQGEVELANQMQNEVDQIEKSGEISAEAKKTILLTSRKTVKLSNE